MGLEMRLNGNRVGFNPAEFVAEAKGEVDVWKVIYEWIDDDTVRLCRGADRKVRPLDFTDKDSVVYNLKRVKF
jgi:hypothetical protein